IERMTGRFDLVTSLEVIEHVSDPAGFVRGLAEALNDDGLLILSTPNRTPLSRLALITLAEGTGRIPRGTHDWDKFLTPEELTDLIERAGLTVTDVT
ncbi:methyltransferase domain-containing protein, partial [Vibrio parahaemolyticus]|nr:methyltransferase domain-containing protein [Vibrio parahaemolyticus]